MAGEQAQSKPKKRRWLKILIIVIAAFVVLIVIAVAASYSATAAPRKATSEFFSMLSSGQVDQAYESTAGMFKQATNKGDFASVVNQFPILASGAQTTFSSWEVKTDGAVTTAQLGGSITGADGTVMPLSVQLIKEQDTWKVLGFELGAAAL